MSEFRPLHEQEAKPLPEEPPVLNLQLTPDFDAARLSEVRHAIINFLCTDPELQSCVGCSIPESLVGDIELSLSELLANAQRPEAGRHATGIYIWAEEHRVAIGVGDDSDTIAGEDERPQTKVLAPDLGAVAIEAYDEDFSFELTAGDELQSSGLGGSLLSMLASRVSYSKVPSEEAARIEEPRTHKIVWADFDIPSTPTYDQAA